ncbi:MAG TPA: hypothetical protein VJL80_05795 [Aeromicrobium sp.]|nr:hypothetical protein [Aeromicrobium sp.]HKY57531.1 hypothetical protein [Aeromicrobium sp.]
MATGWPRIKATCRNVGWGFDPWQDATGRLILAKRDGGRWAADLSILSIPRQVGKSYLLGCIIFALCLLNPKLRVIWTSHHTATTEEMYEAMKELAANKRVAPHVRKCIALQGSRWRITFANGSRIDFGARSQGFGRGKAKVGVMVLDEFQHITGRALSNLVPTMNQAENPLILCAGTPPGPEVSGEAFTLRRKAALEGISDDTLYVEFSADADADLMDRKQWARANPSFPKRTPERAFLLNRKMLSDDDFRREALGIWDQNDRLLVMPNWPLLVSTRRPPPVRALGISVDPDRVWISVGASSDGDSPHLGAVIRRRLDVDRAHVIGEVARIQRETKCAVVFGRKREADSLESDLREAGVRVFPAGLDDYVTACADLYDAVAAKEAEHGDYPELNDAVAAAGWRKVGNRRVWAALSGDISMLEAVTLAKWGSTQSVTTDAWGFYS